MPPRTDMTKRPYYKPVIFNAVSPWAVARLLGLDVLPPIEPIYGLVQPVGSSFRPRCRSALRTLVFSRILPTPSQADDLEKYGDPLTGRLPQTEDWLHAPTWHDGRTPSVKEDAHKSLRLAAGLAANPVDELDPIGPDLSWTGELFT